MNFPTLYAAAPIHEERDKLQLQNEKLHAALVGLLRAPFEGQAQMRATFACLVAGHPSRHADEDVGCICTIRKAGE